MDENTADEYKPAGWRLAGYYPGQYAKSMSALGIGIDYSDDDFDRYESEFLADLAAHDAEVAAAALEEAASAIYTNGVVSWFQGGRTKRDLCNRAAAIRSTGDSP